MPRTAWSVPYGADQTAYLVVDRLGRREGVVREIELERTDIETIISELVAGQFNDPARVIAYNTLGSGMWGLVLSDNSTLVTVEYNLVQGRFQHGIFLTTGTTAARARLLNNTVEQTGRLTSSGDASAVFVASAAQLLLRNASAPNDLASTTNVSASRSTRTDRELWTISIR